MRIHLTPEEASNLSQWLGCQYGSVKDSESELFRGFEHKVDLALGDKFIDVGDDDDELQEAINRGEEVVECLIVSQMSSEGEIEVDLTDEEVELICEIYGDSIPETENPGHHESTPWRQLVRVVDVGVAPCDEREFRVIISGWNPSIKVRIHLDTLPEDIQPLIVPGKRLHARVNIGARSLKSLKFSDWERD